MRVISTVILMAALCFGQTAAHFDVVSIKPNRSVDLGVGMGPTSGGLSIKNMSVNVLIQSAYSLKPWQISGGPGWTPTDRFDIEARAEGNPNFQEKLRMIQPLLADRFQLKFHRETRQLPNYSLTVAKNGAKLQATPAGVQGYIRPGRGLLEGKAVNMRMLAEFLGGSLGVSVTDKTGIEGSFDIKLEWTPTEGEVDYKYEDRPLDPNKSSIFTALQEQLGLRLEAGKGPVEVLVIDHLEHPSEN